MSAGVKRGPPWPRAGRFIAHLAPFSLGGGAISAFVPYTRNMTAEYDPTQRLRALTGVGNFKGARAVPDIRPAKFRASRAGKFRDAGDPKKRPGGRRIIGAWLYKEPGREEEGDGA